MYPEYEKINNLFNRCDELDKTNKEFKDIFEFAFSFRKNNVAAYFFDSKKKLCKMKYKDVEAEIYRVAPKIAKLINGKKDDLVVLKIANSVYWIEYFYASLMAGYRVLLLDAKASKDATDNIIKQTGAVGIVCNEDVDYEVAKATTRAISSMEDIEGFAPNWANEVTFCSSGTTGKAKLAVYTGENMVNQIKACKGMPLQTKTIMYTHDMGVVNILSMIPFHHVFGFVAVFLWYSSWGSAMVFPSSLAPSDIKLICQKVGVTHVYSVPLFWNSLTKELERKVSTQPSEKQLMIKSLMDVNLGKPDAKCKHKKTVEKVVQKSILGNKVKFCISGGGFLPQRTLEVINGIGYPLYNGYGMTEVGVTSVELSADVKDRLKSSIGMPLNQVEYKIDNPDSFGEGELLIKSPYTHVREVIGGVQKPATLDKDGYFHTGDIVRKDEDNRFYIKGRIKDVIINANGENIYPDELELHFKGLNHVNNYSVLGVKKNENEQKIVIVLEVDNCVNNEEADQLVEKIKTTELPGGARIDDVYFAKGKLPVSSSLKVKRFEIKDAIERKTNLYFKVDNLETEEEVVFDQKTIDEIVNPLRKIFASVLSLSEFKIHNKDHFINDLGGDSLLFVELCQEVAIKFNLDIPTEDYIKLTSINDFAKEIVKIKK